jgi:hypothetical protein
MPQPGRMNYSVTTGGVWYAAEGVEGVWYTVTRNNALQRHCSGRQVHGVDGEEGVWYAVTWNNYLQRHFRGRQVFQGLWYAETRKRERN